MNTFNIDKMRESFETAPRKFSFFDRMTTFNFMRPDWAYGEEPDNLNYLFDRMSDVYQNGEVIWGSVIQVNEGLFEKGKDNLPGEVVFSFNDDVNLSKLSKVANKLYHLKSQSPEDPELKKISDYLKDQFIRVYGWNVPKSISPDLNCFISTTFFLRKHFLGKTLNQTTFPIVVLKEAPHFALPLPSKYWTEEFKKWWIGQ